MREFKFRVWDKEQMLYFGFENLDDNFVNVDDKSTDLDSKDCIVMQYIGRNDINNKEIFEGDILLQRFNTFGIKMDDGTIIPGFSGAGPVGTQQKFDFEYKIEVKNIWQILDDTFMYGKCTYEVIGNIYQYPALFNEIIQTQV